MLDVHIKNLFFGYCTDRMYTLLRVCEDVCDMHFCGIFKTREDAEEHKNILIDKHDLYDDEWMLFESKVNEGIFWNAFDYRWKSEEQLKHEAEEQRIAKQLIADHNAAKARAAAAKRAREDAESKRIEQLRASIPTECIYERTRAGLLPNEVESIASIVDDAKICMYQRDSEFFDAKRTALQRRIQHHWGIAEELLAPSYVKQLTKLWKDVGFEIEVRRLSRKSNMELL